MDNYVLGNDARTPIRVSFDAWSRSRTKDRSFPLPGDGWARVAETQLADGTRVSTVFLGLDHSFGSGPPLLFETMVFGGPSDQEQERYSTWAEAEAGHAAMVERLRDALRGEQHG